MIFGCKYTVPVRDYLLKVILRHNLSVRDERGLQRCCIRMPCVELQDVVCSYSDTFFDRENGPHPEL